LAETNKTVWSSVETATSVTVLAEAAARATVARAMEVTTATEATVTTVEAAAMSGKTERHAVATVN